MVKREVPITVCGAFVMLSMLFLIGCSSVGYVSRQAIKDSTRYNDIKSDVSTAKQYGAISFNTNKLKKKMGLAAEDSVSDEVGSRRSFSAADDTLFLLHKKSGRYYAENMFHSSRDKKYFFSFGYNKRTHGPDIGIRVEF